MKCFCVLLSGWRYGRIFPGPHAERHHRPAQQDQSGQLLLVSRPPIANICNNIINNNNNILGKTESVGLVHCVHLYGFIWEKFSKVVRWQHFSIFRKQVILDKLSLIGRPDNGFTSVTGCATFSLFPKSNVPDLVSRIDDNFHCHSGRNSIGSLWERAFHRPTSPENLTEFRHVLQQSIAFEKLYKLVFESATIGWSVRPRIHEKWPRGSVAPPVVRWFSWNCGRTVNLIGSD